MKRTRLRWDPGQLRHRILVQSPTEIFDESGGFETTWNDKFNCWALLEHRQSTNTVRARARESDVEFTVTTRWRDDIFPDDRVVFDGRNFRIRNVKDPDESKRYLVMRVEEEMHR